MMQTILALLLVLLALGYVGLRIYRAARTASRKDAGCGASCGCDASPPSKHAHG